MVPAKVHQRMRAIGLLIADRLRSECPVHVVSSIRWRFEEEAAEQEQKPDLARFSATFTRGIVIYGSEDDECAGLSMGIVAGFLHFHHL